MSVGTFKTKQMIFACPSQQQSPLPGPKRERPPPSEVEMLHLELKKAEAERSQLNSKMSFNTRFTNLKGAYALRRSQRDIQKKIDGIKKLIALK
jgi:hypothetical protein